MLQMSNLIGTGRLALGGKGGEALDREMPLDAIGRIVTLDFLIACQLKCLNLPEGEIH